MRDIRDAIAGLAARDLNLLFGLRALLEESNVTRAAASMQMGQPAMSAVLSRLRVHYEDELLVRFGREYELTPLARVLLPYVQDAAALIERSLGVQPMSFEPATSERQFSVLTTSYGSYAVLEDLIAIGEEAPGLHVGLVEVDAGDETSPRTWRSHDLVLSTTPGPAEFRARLVREDHYVGVASLTHPLLHDGALDGPTFAESEFVSTNGAGANAEAALFQALMNRSVEFKPRVAVEGYTSVLRIVAGTDLVAVLPESVTGILVDDEEVAVFELPYAHRIPLHLYVSWHSSRQADPGLAWVTGMLRGRPWSPPVG